MMLDLHLIQRKVKLVVVDDQKLFRDGLVSLLKDHDQFEIHCAANGKEFLNSLTKLTPDVILLDIEMPEMGGQHTTELIQKYYPSIKVIILTSYCEPELAFRMVQLGARGYLDKDVAIETVVDAINAVIGEKGYYFNEYLTKEVLHEIQFGGKCGTQAGFFTERQEEILELICDEFSNNKIAKKLFLSEKTVERERAYIMKKTGKKKLAGLIAYNIRRKIWNRFWFKANKKVGTN